MSAAQALAIIFAPRHLRRTGAIAVLVGLWLSAFNQGDLLLAGAWSAALGVKLALNFLTPFVVSNLGLLSRTAQR
jgi:hypothetical protein